MASDKEADENADYLDSKANKSALCNTSINLSKRGGKGFYASIMIYKSILEQKDFREKMNGINVPVLILKGQYDNQPWGATNEYLSLILITNFYYKNAYKLHGLEEIWFIPMKHTINLIKTIFLK